MKRAILIVLLATGMAARADEASHRQRAEEALSLMDVQKNIEQSFEAMKKMQLTQMQSMNMSAVDTEKAQAIQAEVLGVIQDEFSWEKIKTDYVQIYMDTFTEEELKGLIEFYNGPVGRKFVEKTPELMQRSMAISQKQMATIMPKIQEITRKSSPTARPFPPPVAPGK